jgi:Fe2+ or Zn2+ uptake regulation protein
LKATVVDILLRSDRALSAQEVRRRFTEADGVPALTTVLTVLDRLRRAGEVERSTGTDGDYVFALSSADSDIAAETMLDTLLRTSDRSGALMRFAGALDAQDTDVLRRALQSRTRRT